MTIPVEPLTEDEVVNLFEAYWNKLGITLWADFDLHNSDEREKARQWVIKVFRGIGLVTVNEVVPRGWIGQERSNAIERSWQNGMLRTAPSGISLESWLKQSENGHRTSE